MGAEPNAIPDLRSNIIFCEILPRLPGKSLMRFKSVSKRWSTLPREPFFVGAHQNFQCCRNNTQTNLLLWITTRSILPDCITLNLEPSIFSVQIGGEGISPTPVTHLLKIPEKVQSISYGANTNGLISLCFRDHDPNMLRIFNPSTRESVTLPLPDSPNVIAHCIGFSHLTKEHKVLQMHQILERPPQYSEWRMSCMFKILSLGGTNATSWRQLDVDLRLDPRHFDFDSGSVCLYGAIHWVYPSQNMIVVFDVGDERFKTMPLPEDDDISGDRREGVTPQGILEVGGCLAVFDYKLCVEEQQYTMRLWVLKNYKKQAWVKETILFPLDCSSVFGLQLHAPLGTIHTGELLFHYHIQDIDTDHVWLKLYNMKTKTFRRIEIILPEGMSLNDVSVKLLTSYHESLVPLS